MRKIWWIGPLLVLGMLSGWWVPGIAQWIDQRSWPGSVKTMLAGPLPPNLIRREVPWFWQVGSYPGHFERLAQGFSVQLDHHRVYVPRSWSVPQDPDLLAGNRVQVALPFPGPPSRRLPVSVVAVRSWLVCPQGIKSYARRVFEPVPYRDCANFWQQYEEGLRHVMRSYEEERVPLRFELVKNLEDDIPFIGLCQDAAQASCEIMVEYQGLTGLVSLPKEMYKMQGVEVVAYVQRSLAQLRDPSNAL